MRGALMVCGTASDVGKSLVVLGLCRVLSRHGVRVAPFKGQNMALNAAVTRQGAEIGRAQWAQAVAAGVEPEPAMNPVLLKPTGEARSQVVVMGRPWKTLEAAEYHAAKAELVDVVLEALEDLRRRFDVVLCEGAGSPAEINLLENDLVNLGLASRMGIPAILVGDIDRGGVFAHLFGTVELLPPALRRNVRGFVINKFRGDPALVGSATEELDRRLGIPTLGILPWLDHGVLDVEDSLTLDRLTLDRAREPRARTQRRGQRAQGLPLEASDDLVDVAVIRFPRVSNFTDLEPLAFESGVQVRWIEHPAELGRPDLIILPGTKATIADLGWLRDSGLAGAIIRASRASDGPTVLGICGGYQMLGSHIVDTDGVEAPPHSALEGLQLLGVTTTFEATKHTALRQGVDLFSGHRVEAYQMHHGRVTLIPGTSPWFCLQARGANEREGAVDPAGRVYGTSLHGLFECTGFRSSMLEFVARRRGKQFAPSGVDVATTRRTRADLIADACERHLDLRALWALIEEGRS